MVLSTWLVIPPLFIIATFLYTLWVYKIKAPSVPGPSFVWPLVGQIWRLIKHPHEFWLTQESYGDLSKTLLPGNRLMIFSAKSEYSNKVFKENTGENLRIVIGLNDEVFSDQNISCLHGPEHTFLRKSLLQLFTRHRLGVYVETQQNLIRQIFGQWLKDFGGKEVEFRNLARDLNMYTSLRVLMGSYITEDEIDSLNEMFYIVNSGLIALPVNLPGTPLNKAIATREKLMEKLRSVVRNAHKNFLSHKDNQSVSYYLLENVINNLRREQAKKDNNGVDDQQHKDLAGHEFTDLPELPETGPWSVTKVANVILNLLFASQDASTSSIVWSVHLLDKHRDVLEKVRQEQLAIRPNDEPITHELLDKMTYTHQVVKEILRFRPPAIMVPHEAKTDFDIDGHKIPKGSLIMPSIMSAVNQGFTNPYEFNPDRFSETNREDVTYARNYLVFGAGPHSCIGREYAINQLKVFTALFASLLDVKRRVTDRSEELVMGPTTFPADGCPVVISSASVYTH